MNHVTHRSAPDGSHGWARTFSNFRIDFADPDPAQIHILDIAVGLSRAPRWGGHTNTEHGVSVAQHSILVADIVDLLGGSPKDRLVGLLHDASEGLGLIDLPTPAKHLMPEYKIIETRLMLAVAARFNFSWPEPRRVKDADRCALLLENRHYLTPSLDFEPSTEERDLADRMDDALKFGECKPLGETEARDAFLDAFDKIQREF